ncbi:MAG: phenylacetate--CoA ligase [Candidatus Erginobacter occultus]|nr:phenylacetate--CoA ligase [Candidatus Erginobacter occultus]
MNYWDRNIETIGREELAALQLQRLKETVARALNSPYYRKVLGDNNLSPDSIRSLDDLRRFPFTAKDDLRASYPRALLAVDREEVVRMHASSGTTGQSTVVYHNLQDLENWTGLVARCLVMAGATRGDVFQNMMSYGLFTGGIGLHYGAERVGMMVIPIGGGNTHRQIQFFQDFGTTIIHITPSYALHVSDVIRDLGLSPDDFRLRVLIFGAEPYSEATREKLEQLYRVRALNCYGLSEMNGPGVAFECGMNEGMHVWEDSYIVEVIDPESGDLLPPGDEGEIVFTTLTREAMPLIRYRSRDLARLYERTDCSCGRNFRRLSRIIGRTDDMLIVRGVNVFPSQIEHELMRIPEVGTNYQILLDRVENLDRMTVRVEITGRTFHGEVGELRLLKKKIEHALKEEILITTEIELMEPGALPPSQGKAKRVIDNREM